MEITTYDFSKIEEENAIRFPLELFTKIHDSLFNLSGCIKIVSKYLLRKNIMYCFKTICYVRYVKF